MTPYILGIETSTTNCSVGLFRGNEVIHIKEVNSGYSHSENLAPFVEDLLKETEVKSSDLNALAVGMGPGSYTGLRIGVSLVKGLAFGLNIPIIGLSSLQIMAAEVQSRIIKVEDKDAFLSLLDARRMEVYASAYNAELSEVLPPAAIVLESDSFSTLVNDYSRVFVFGPGAEKFVHQSDHSDSFVYVEEIFPSVKGMNELAFSAFSNQRFLDTAYFEPFYLKDFIAGKPSRNLLSPDN
ncbi:tRNA (adenosine(37)-N6)-threonylcarbamoyltransferase complex dimerization subunit type 1 TsaB [bacterium SCSIO 12741]|nr:tRNA (adenosine(37)-N6)-threonylcarbamoyltransferase complex dimerization subunit type 1 TsaB [bacterium SCSIO 12741]